jgi:hypothetical protein
MPPETLTPREVLDGLVERRLKAFDATTDASEPRVLFVPFHITECPATALLICRGSGLLRSKLDKMTDADASYVYLTTIAKREPEN